MDRFAGSAFYGIDRMSAKNVALSLNSLAQRKGHEAFFEASIGRILQLCHENHEFHSQSLAMMVNALVKRRLYARTLFTAIAGVAQVSM